MARRISCDRCGETLADDVSPLVLLRWRGELPADADTADLCTTCYGDFKAWLTRGETDSETRKEQDG